MRVKITLTTFIICLLGINLSAQSLEEVMDNYFEKICGKDKVALIRSSQEISLNWFRRKKDDDPLNAKLIKTTTILKVPYYKKFVSYDSKGNVENEFFYSKKGSVLAMGSVIQKNKVQNPISICVASDLLESYQKKKLDYRGERNLDGENYFVIGKGEGKGAQLFYFNQKTHLLCASQLQDWPDRITYYKEYRKTNSILHPFLLESFQNQIIYYKQITDSYEFNPEIDDHIFYFNEKEYLKRTENKVKYSSKRLEVKESEFRSFIKANFEGKRVFVDIWATWCGPCKKEFNGYDSAYYAFMEKNNINLLYLSIDKDSAVKSWEKDIAYLGLKGFHARASNKLMQSIQTVIFKDSLVVIPRYVLIDDNGKILSIDFIRPSNPSFSTEINRLFVKGSQP